MTGLRNLAPILALTAGLALPVALAAQPASAESAAAPAAEEVRAGPLILSGAFTRATLPNAPVGGGFVTIRNTGDSDDQLIGAASPIAGHAEIHEMKMEGNVMKMRQLQDGLPIPAGKTVTLKTGGYHVMFMDLTGPIRQGERVPVTLIFRKAGRVEIRMPAGAPNARAPAMGHQMEGHQMEGHQMEGHEMKGHTSGALAPRLQPQPARVTEAG